MLLLKTIEKINIALLKENILCIESFISPKAFKVNRGQIFISFVITKLYKQNQQFV